jgi:hypothetical protein
VGQLEKSIALVDLPNTVVAQDYTVVEAPVD